MSERRQIQGPIPPRTAFEDLLEAARVKEDKEYYRMNKSKKVRAGHRASAPMKAQVREIMKAERSKKPVTEEEAADHYIREEEMKPKPKARKPKKADA